MRAFAAGAVLGALLVAALWLMTLEVTYWRAPHSPVVPPPVVREVPALGSDQFSPPGPWDRPLQNLDLSGKLEPAPLRPRVGGGFLRLSPWS